MNIMSSFHVILTAAKCTVFVIVNLSVILWLLLCENSKREPIILQLFDHHISELFIFFLHIEMCFMNSIYLIIIVF